MKIPSPTALVIGSRGNLGPHLVNHLDRAGWRVFKADCLPGVGTFYQTVDICRAGDLRAVFDWAKPDIVFNLAALAGRVVAEIAPEQALAINVDGAHNVARLSSEHGARLIHISTSEVYGPHKGMSPGDMLHPINWYGMTKAMGEEAVRYQQDAFVGKPDYAIVRPFMLYHESEADGDHRSVMARFARAIAAGEQVVVHEGSKRGWLHYEDAARFLEAIALSKFQGPMNIGHPDLRDIGELPAMMSEILGCSVNFRIEPVPPRMTGVKNPCLIEQVELGLFPEVTLEDGVKRVCERAMERRDHG